jgi:hypothetical protein
MHFPGIVKEDISSGRGITPDHGIRQATVFLLHPDRRILFYRSSGFLQLQYL